MRVKVKFSRIKLNNTLYLRDTERAINKVVKEAAREFLITVLKVISGAPHTVGDNFPIQTGEAKGSLLPLGALLNQSQQRVSIPITPAPGRPNRISIGRSKGQVKLGPTGRKLIYVFEYSTDVLHFQINEITASSIPKSITPWYALLAGFTAFEVYINNNLFSSIPKLNKYLVTSEI